MERRKQFFFVFLQLKPNKFDIKHLLMLKYQVKRLSWYGRKELLGKQNSFTLKLPSIDLQLCQKIHSQKSHLKDLKFA